MAAWKASVSGSSCVRRRSSTGVRSAPPPNHALVVTTKRVFMCTAGTCGLCRWAISEMPEAQKRGSSARPESPCGIPARTRHARSRQCTPTFSNTRPFIIDITPPPPGLPEWSVRLPRRAHEAARRAVAQRRAGRQRILHGLERRADVVAQLLEPRARARLSRGDQGVFGRRAHGPSAHSTNRGSDCRSGFRETREDGGRVIPRRHFGELAVLEKIPACEPA